MFRLAIRDFILQNDNWEELLKAEPYCLKIARDGDYISFSYNQIGSDFNLEIVREARGIIFRESDWTCVAYAFSKFGNWGESYVTDFDFSSMVVSEKIDGSLMKVWYDDGWHVSTNGTIDANKALLNNAKYKTFADLFAVAAEKVGLDFSRLRKNHTYIFELVSPYSQVVIPYEEVNLYTLGARNMDTGKEISMERAAAETGVASPKIYLNKTFKQIKAMADELPWDNEGYVCVDKNFNRCKIKSPAYVAAHYMRNNNVITPKRIIDVIRGGEEEEFLLYCPEYSDILYDYKNQLRELENFAVAAQNIFRNFNGLRAERYEAICKYTPVRALQIFIINDHWSWENFTSDWFADKFLSVLEQFNKREV